MAFVIANELGVNPLKQIQGPVIEKAGDLVAILNDLEPGDVLLSTRSLLLAHVSRRGTLQCYGRFLTRHHDWCGGR